MFRNPAPKAELKSFPNVPLRVDAAHLHDGCLLTSQQKREALAYFDANPLATRGPKIAIVPGKKVYTLRLTHPVTQFTEVYVTYLGGAEKAVGSGYTGTLRYLQSLNNNQWYVLKKEKALKPGSWYYWFKSFQFNLEFLATITQLEIENLKKLEKLQGLMKYDSRDGYYTKFLIAMEWVAGVELFELLKDGKHSPQRWLMIMEAVARAVKEFSNKGWIHDDLKLENVMIEREAVLIDFQAMGAAPKHMNLNFGFRADAPELNHTKKEAEYSEATSVYRFGEMFRYALDPQYHANKDVLGSDKLRLDVACLLEMATQEQPENRPSFAAIEKTLHLIGLQQPDILQRVHRVGLVDLNEFVRFGAEEQQLFFEQLPFLDVLYFVDLNFALEKQYIRLRKLFEEHILTVSHQVIGKKDPAILNLFKLLSDVPSLLAEQEKQHTSFIFCTKTTWVSGLDSLLSSKGVLVLNVGEPSHYNHLINDFLAKRHLTVLQYELVTATLEELQPVSDESAARLLKNTIAELKTAKPSPLIITTMLRELEGHYPAVRMLTSVLAAQDKRYGVASLARLALV